MRFFHFTCKHLEDAADLAIEEGVFLRDEGVIPTIPLHFSAYATENRKTSMYFEHKTFAYGFKKEIPNISPTMRSYQLKNITFSFLKPYANVCVKNISTVYCSLVFSLGYAVHNLDDDKISVFECLIVHFCYVDIALFNETRYSMCYRWKCIN